MIEKEIWKDIPNYEGLYQVSNYGKVKSFLSNKILTPRISRYGYLRVSLRKDGLTKDFYIHRLVGEVFLNKPNYKCEMSHKDTNKQNNVYTNLEWVTHKENQNNPISVKKQLRKNNHRFGKSNDYNSYKNRCYKIKCIETNKIYLSIHKASNETGIPFSSIQYHLKGKLDNAGGYHWQKL